MKLLRMSRQALAGFLILFSLVSSSPAYSGSIQLAATAACVASGAGSRTTIFVNQEIKCADACAAQVKCGSTASTCIESASITVWNGSPSLFFNYDSTSAECSNAKNINSANAAGKICCCSSGCAKPATLGTGFGG